MITLGIDPGGRNTGIVVRDGDRLLHHAVIVRTNQSVADYARMVADVVDRKHYEVWHTYFESGIAPVRIEALEPPKGFAKGKRAPINPASLIDAGIVLGALLVTFPDAVLVPPKGNGSRPLDQYPPELVGEREVKGGGVLRHARSAWDVAGHE